MVFLFDERLTTKHGTPAAMTDELRKPAKDLLVRYLRQGLETLQQRHEVIGDVRGQGLLIGVELVQDRERRIPHHALGARTTERCFELGLSMNIRRRRERGSVWRIAPPLTVSHDEIDSALDIADRSLKDGTDELSRNGPGT